MNDKTEVARSEPAELAIAALAGGALGLMVMLWLWASVSGLLFGRGWPHLGLPALLHGLAGLGGHLSDPRLAFPAPARGALPGPAGFYATAAVLIVPLAAGALAAMRGAERFRAGGAGSGKGAQWAQGRQLAPLHTRPLDPSRFTQRARDRGQGQGLALGYRSGRLLRAEERHALVVFGPTQSGKSAGLAIPNILEWEGPAIVVSIKPDLLDDTLSARQARGEALVFDPLAQWGLRSSTWSPVACAGTWLGALQSALRLASVGEIDSSTVKGGSFWAKAAEQRIAPLLYAAARHQLTMAEVVRWIYGQGGVELDRLMDELPRRAGSPEELLDSQHALDAHLAFTAVAGETRMSIETTAQILLEAYRSPIVQRSANGSEISAQRLLAGANTLYLISDPQRSKLLRPLLLALLSELIDGAYEHANHAPGRRLPLPLLICLDELGNTVPLPNLAEIASSAASHNIQLISVFHDIAQARTRYRDQALTVINNHRARMLLPGVADMETLRYFSELVGDEEIREPSQKRDTPPRRRPLAAPDQLRQLKRGRGLLVYGSLPPTVLRLRLWFKHRRLRRLHQPAQETA